MAGGSKLAMLSTKLRMKFTMQLTEMKLFLLYSLGYGTLLNGADQDLGFLLGLLFAKLDLGLGDYIDSGRYPL